MISPLTSPHVQRHASQTAVNQHYFPFSASATLSHLYSPVSPSLAHTHALPGPRVHTFTPFLSFSFLFVLPQTAVGHITVQRRPLRLSLMRSNDVDRSGGSQAKGCAAPHTSPKGGFTSTGGGGSREVNGSMSVWRSGRIQRGVW